MVYCCNGIGTVYGQDSRIANRDISRQIDVKRPTEYIKHENNENKLNAHFRCSAHVYGVRCDELHERHQQHSECVFKIVFVSNFRCWGNAKTDFVQVLPDSTTYTMRWKCEQKRKENYESKQSTAVGFVIEHLLTRRWHRLTTIQFRCREIRRKMDQNISHISSTRLFTLLRPFFCCNFPSVYSRLARIFSVRLNNTATAEIYFRSQVLRYISRWKLLKNATKWFHSTDGRSMSQIEIWSLPYCVAFQICHFGVKRRDAGECQNRIPIQYTSVSTQIDQINDSFFTLIHSINGPINNNQFRFWLIPFELFTTETINHIWPSIHKRIATNHKQHTLILWIDMRCSSFPNKQIPHEFKWFLCQFVYCGTSTRVHHQHRWLMFIECESTEWGFSSVFKTIFVRIGGLGCQQKQQSMEMESVWIYF